MDTHIFRSFVEEVTKLAIAGNVKIEKPPQVKATPPSAPAPVARAAPTSAPKPPAMNLQAINRAVQRPNVRRGAQAGARTMPGAYQRAAQAAQQIRTAPTARMKPMVPATKVTASPTRTRRSFIPRPAPRAEFTRPLPASSIPGAYPF